MILLLNKHILSAYYAPESERGIEKRYKMSKSLPLSSRTLSLVRIGSQLRNGVISINVRLKQRGVRLWE